MITVKPVVNDALKKYSTYMKFGKFSFTRDNETKGTFSLEITMLKAKFSYAVATDSSSEMDVVQKFCTELVKAFA